MDSAVGMARRLYSWNVTLQTSDGQVGDRRVEAYWDPQDPGTPESVGHAAKAQIHLESRGQMQAVVVAPPELLPPA